MQASSDGSGVKLRMDHSVKNAACTYGQKEIYEIDKLLKYLKSSSQSITLRLDAGPGLRKKLASRKLQEGIDYEVDNIAPWPKN